MDNKTILLLGLIPFALLAVVIAIAIGIYLFPIAPPPMATCSFGNSGLFCDQPDTPTLASDGTLSFTLTNGFKIGGLKNVQVACAFRNGTQAIAAPGAFTSIGNFVQLQQRPVLLKCTDYSGAAGYPSGAWKNGVIFVRYSFDGDPSGAPAREEQARFAAVVK